MYHTFLSLAICLVALSLPYNIGAQNSHPYTRASSNLIEALRKGKAYQATLDSIQNVSEDVLAKELNQDDLKKTFWVNIYNAYIQISLTEDASRFEQRPGFYKDIRYKVAGRMLSFEKIEHGILRKSRIPLGLGYIGKLFPGKFERTFRVKKVDPRIHFALNCGAKDCPAVAAYFKDRVNDQFDISTQKHLEKTSKYDAESNEVFITSLFSWFRGDWGSKRKRRNFLKKYKIIPNNAKPKLKHTKYDWEIYIGNYIEL